jgi:hypothetical protein
MEYFDVTKNKVLFGNTDKLSEWVVEISDQAKAIDKIKLMLKIILN